MGKVTDNLYQIYVTEETNCAASLMRAGISSREPDPPAEYYRMMSGFSGGVSTENFCGAILGGVAAIGHLINHGDEESFEASKAATEEFVMRCQQEFDTLSCHEIKTVWRKEDIRCYDAVAKIGAILEDILNKYVPEEWE